MKSTYIKTLPLLVAATLLQLPLTARAERACPQTLASPGSAITELCPVKNGMARILVGHRWGFIDTDGKVAIAPQFDMALDFAEGHAAVQQDEKWGMIDKQGKWIVPATLDDLDSLSSGLAAASLDGKYGYLDAAGTWVIAPAYEHGAKFSGDVAVVRQADGTELLIDKRGNVVKRFPGNVGLERYFVSKTGMFVAKLEPAAELVNLNGRRVPLPAGADSATYSDGQFVASKLISHDKQPQTAYGSVDLKGKWIIAPTLRRLSRFEGKLAIASPLAQAQDGRELLGLINRKGKFVVQPGYLEITRQDDGRYRARPADGANRLDVLDANGKLLYAIDCSDVYGAERSGVLSVVSGCDRKWLLHEKKGVLASYDNEHMVDIKGEHLLIERAASEEQDRAMFFEIYNSAGKRVAASDPAHKTYGAGYDTVGLIAPVASPRDARAVLPVAYLGNFAGSVALLTRDYKLVTRPDWRYDSALLNYSGRDTDQVEGPMIMKGREGFGAVDTKGNWIIAPALSSLSRFKHGVAQARMDGDEFMFDARGKRYAYPEQGFRFTRTAYMVVEGSSEEGTVSFDLRSGAVSIRPDDAQRWSPAERVGGLLPVEKGGKWGLTDEKTQWVLAPGYDTQPTPVIHQKKHLGWLTHKIVTTTAGTEKLAVLLDPKGRELIAARYSALQLDERSGLLIATTDGYLNSVVSPQGKTLINAVHGDLASLGDGWFAAKMTTLHGLIDQRGEWVAPPGRVEFKLDTPDNPAQDRPYTVEHKGGKPHLTDIRGRLSTAVAPRELAVEEPSSWWWHEEEPAEDGSTTFYGYNFKERVKIAGLPTQSGFSEGTIAFKPAEETLQQKIGLADDQGKVIGMFDYTSIGPMADGMAKVEATIKVGKRRRATGGEPVSRYGFIDRSGKLAVPAVYEQAASFSEQRTTVVKNGGLALIDAKGKILLQGAWQCGRTPTLLDGKKKVLWPEAAKKVSSCAKRR